MPQWRAGEPAVQTCNTRLAPKGSGINGQQQNNPADEVPAVLTARETSSMLGRRKKDSCLAAQAPENPRQAELTLLLSLVPPLL